MDSTPSSARTPRVRTRPSAADVGLGAIAPRLALAEQVLSLLKPLAQGTPLWEDSAWTSNEMLQRGTPFSELVLNTDCTRNDESARFLQKHWLAAEGAPVDATAFFVAKEAGPRWLTLRTKSRLAYRQALVDFAQALDGLPVYLEESRSWTWERGEDVGEQAGSDGASLRTQGSRPSRHRTVYLLSVYLGEKRPFEAGVWLRHAGRDICTSVDARADRCLFELVAEAGLPKGLAHAWSPTAQGFEVTCANEAAAQRVIQALFSDCLAPSIKKGPVRPEVVFQVALP